ncbi:hydroxyethylthiazole kinase-like uncharacterized protein yjeF [Microbacterium resistens]|uniref:ADP-dependent (S)-NAD(P)H-hydrate dehydratase n=1 Tax=Microbacterium resistens TaxID=156977 RepID=A0ABU1SAV5_9MICO|nr:ADP/ATP-dependent (S)-NAD(P)H-hydrate dehydratase [Microbacterium resistens]MDR6866388.1 hydroxyethylthiazole kinase-like uncharacterized protein yjeF [Microbacterium resistens]
MPQLRVWTRDDTSRLLRTPGDDDDKRSRGVVALRTGSPAYPGAAVLGVEAAWRSGSGYVRFLGEQRLADAVLLRRPETVVESGHADALPAADAWVIGSGTDPADRTDAERALLQTVLRGGAPVVVDAGALDLAPDASAPILVTPHAGELGRLRAELGLAVIGSDQLREPETRARVVAETAAALDGVVLLKGARTLVADPAGTVIAIEAGTGWLATAGTGDVLAGVLGTLLAANPGTELSAVAAAGAWLHGHAGRIAAGVADTNSAAGTGDTDDGGGGRPIVAMDVAEALPRAVEGVLA